MLQHSKSSRQSLPLEVCEVIIGLVDAQRLQDSYCSFTIIKRKTLYSCALVCRDWVPKSRIHLFRSVGLNNRQQAGCFMTTVSTIPQLGEYVQALEISLRDDSLYRIHQVLPPLLPRLAHLQYSHLPVLHPVFIVLASRFKMVTSLRFDDFERQSFREVVQILNRFPHLRKLELSGCSWKSPGLFYCRRQKRGKHAIPVQLSVSTFEPSTFKGFGQAGDTIQWLMKKQSFNTLNEYRCNSTTDQCNNLHDLVATHAESLKRLELNIEPCASGSDPALHANDLAQCQLIIDFN